MGSNDPWSSQDTKQRGSRRADRVHRRSEDQTRRASLGVLPGTGSGALDVLQAPQTTAHSDASPPLGNRCRGAPGVRQIQKNLQGAQGTRPAPQRRPVDVEENL